MAHLSKSAVTLRISSDDLIPDEITKLLGCVPTKSHIKGQAFQSRASGAEIIKKNGMWRLETADCEPENLDSQVEKLLAKLTQDLAVWSNLTERFDIDLFCGFFMNQSNEGAEMSSSTLRSLGERGIKLSLDIYGPITELEDDGECSCGR